MEQVLLWVSLAVGVVLYLCRFLPQRATVTGSSAESAGTVAGIVPAMQPIVIAIPFVGFLLTLALGSAPLFHDGQRLGTGFFIGGIATLLSYADLYARRQTDNSSPPYASTTLLTSAYGMNIIAVVLALMFLRQSLFDGLMGVAIGGFCVTFALFLSVPRTARQESETSARLAAGIGMLLTLAAAACLGVFRDPLTPELNKLTWSGVLVAFAAMGSLLVAGTQLSGLGRGGILGRIASLAVLVGVGGLALYQMATRITNTAELAVIGIGGLLLFPVATAVLREAQRRGASATAAATPLLSVPLLSVLVITSGFLAAVQSLQGVGVAVLTLALFLAYPATLTLTEQPEENAEGAAPVSVANGAVGLLLFGTLLLLWRLFATRWAGDLRGVNLTDQYALFGLLVGAALPGLLAALPRRLRDGEAPGNGAFIGTLLLCAILTVAAPAAVLVLFGAKSAVALVIGLALGSVPLLSGRSSLLPALFALGVALALNQFTGTLLPAETPTRAEKVRYLAFIMSGIVVAVLLAGRIGNGNAKDGAETE